MIGRWLAVWLLCWWTIAVCPARAESRPPAAGQVLGVDIPAVFEHNTGQCASGVRFVSRGINQSTFLLDRGEIVVSFAKLEADGTSVAERRRGGRPRKSRTSAIRMRFRGAKKPSAVEALDPAPGVTNYLVGADTRRWRRGVQVYQRVAYRGIYPGIDVVYRGNGAHLEYDFEIAPGADPRQIKIEFDGGSSLSINSDGSAGLAHGCGSVVLRRPVAFQVVGGSRREVECKFRKESNQTLVLETGEYDRGSKLVVDPVIVYSSTIGGTAPFSEYADGASRLCLDAQGNQYITGVMTSADFPVFGENGAPADSTRSGPHDAFVLKLDAAGIPRYATFLGGSGGELPYEICVDAGGHVYVTGATSSTDLPVVNALQPAYSQSIASRAYGYNAFISKLAPDGGSLTFSTYLPYATANGLAIAPDGTPYVGASANWVDFTTNNNPCFIVKLAPAGNAILSATRIFGADFVTRCHLDAQGNIYASGSAMPLTPVPALSASQAGWLSTRRGGIDGFLASFNPAGQLRFLTYFGGSDFDLILQFAFTPLGEIVVSGFTHSPNFPLVNAFSTARSGPNDGVLVKLSADGKIAQFSTLLGGNDLDYVNSVAVRPSGMIVVAGQTMSWDFPVVRPILGDHRPPVLPPQGDYQSDSRWDAFVSEFDPSGRSLGFSTCIGGDQLDTAYEMVVASPDSIVMVGYTWSTNFPGDINAFQPLAPRPPAGWVMKLQLEDEPRLGLIVDPDAGRAGTAVSLLVTSDRLLTDGPMVSVGGQPTLPVTRSNFEYSFRRELGGNEGEPTPVVEVRATSVQTAVLTTTPLRTDFTPPQASSLAVSPSFATTGTHVAVSFLASEALAQVPVVTLGGRPAVSGSSNPPSYVFSRTLDGSEAEGTATVLVNLVDSLGNAGITTGVVTVDFTAPRFAFVSVQPASASPGTTVQIEVDVDDTLDGPPVLTVGGQPATARSATGSRYLFERVIDGSEGEGRPPLRVAGADRAGNRGEATSTGLEVQLPPLSLAVQAAPAYAKLGTTVTVEVTASRIPTQAPEVSFGGVSMSLDSASGLRYRYTRVLTGTESQGATTIRASARAAAGPDVVNDSERVVVDFTPPALTSLFVSPDSASAYSTVRVTLTASEPLRGSPVTSIGGQPAQELHHSGETYTFGLQPVATDGEGSKPVLVTIVDLAGNSVTDATRSVTYDFTPPTFTLVRARPEVAKRRDTVELVLSASESLRSTPGIALSPPTTSIGEQFAFLRSVQGQTYTFDLTVGGSLPEGEPEFFISAADRAGNPSSSTVRPFRTDFTPPTFTTVGVSPSAVGLNGLIEVQLISSEPVSDSTTVTIGGQAATKVFGNGNVFRFQLEAGVEVGDGVRPVRIDAADLAGNTVRIERTVLTDFFPPRIEARVDAATPREGTAAAFSSTGTTAPSGIAGYHWDFGHGESSSDPNPTHTFADGPRQSEVTLTVTNTVGSVGSRTILVDVANVSPTVVVNPVSTPVSGRTTITWSTRDPGQQEQLQRRIVATDLVSSLATELTTFEADTGQAILDFTLLPDSSYQLEVQVRDKDGGTGRGSSSPFIVDNAPLRVDVQRPDPETFNPGFGETTDIKCFLSEPATVRLELSSLGSGQRVALIQAETSRAGGLLVHRWDGRDAETGGLVPAGDYVVTVRALDLLGKLYVANSGQLRITVNSYARPPEPPFLYPQPPPRTRFAAYELGGFKDWGAGIRVKRAGTAIATVPLTDSTSWSAIVPLAEGSNDLSVSAFDTFGAESAAVPLSLVLKTTRPPPIEVSPPISPASTSSQLLAIRRDPSTAVYMNDQFILPAGQAPNISLRVDYGTGSTTFSFEAEDDVGNRSDPTQVTIVLPAGLVSAPGLFGVPNLNREQHFYASGDKQLGTGVEVTVKGIDDPSFNYSVRVPPDSWTFWFEAILAAEGRNTITAQAFDESGNRSAVVSAALRVDSTAPALQITGVSEGQRVTDGELVVVVETQDPAPASGVAPASLTARLDGQVVQPQGSFNGSTAVFRLTGLTGGTHRFDAVVSDLAGNRSTRVVRSFNRWIDDGASTSAVELSDAQNRSFAPDNPYGDDRVFSFVASTSEPASLTVVVTDATGNTVRTWTLPEGPPNSDRAVTFDGKLDSGEFVSSGLYMVTVTATNPGGRISAPASIECQIYY